MKLNRLACALTLAVASIVGTIQAQPDKPTARDTGSSLDTASLDCKNVNCAVAAAKHAIALSGACIAGACPGGTGPRLPGLDAVILPADKQAQLARGLALIASVYGIPPEQLYQLHKVEADRLRQASKTKR